MVKVHINNTKLIIIANVLETAHQTQRVPNTTLKQISSPRCRTYYTTGQRGQLNTHYHLTTYPSSVQSTWGMTIDCNKTYEHLQTARKPTGHNLPKTQSTFTQTTIPTNIHTANIIFTNIFLMADKHNRVRCTAIARPHSMQNLTKKQHEDSKHLLSSSQYKQNVWKEHLDAHRDHRSKRQ